MIDIAALLASIGNADMINLHAFGADGDEVVATLLLDRGSNLMVETTHTSIEEPDNAETEMYIREQMMFLSSPRIALPVDHTMPDNYEDLDMHHPHT